MDAFPVKKSKSFAIRVSWPPLLEAEAGRPRHIPFGWQIATLDTATAATGHRSVSTLPPAHKVRLSTYFIDIHEIAIDEFHPYVRGAVFVRLAGKLLPTADGWEKAVRGTGGRVYAWSNDWSKDTGCRCAKDLP